MKSTHGLILGTLSALVLPILRMAELLGYSSILCTLRGEAESMGSSAGCQDTVSYRNCLEMVSYRIDCDDVEQRASVPVEMSDKNRLYFFVEIPNFERCVDGLQAIVKRAVYHLG